MAKIGRPRAYKTKKALKDAVDGYFASISYTRNVIIRRREIAEGDKGPEVREIPEELMDAKGDHVLETVWLEEPSKSGLCLYLGISRDTWARYAKDDKLKSVVQYVDTRVLQRLEELLSTKNSVRGIEFNLKANYGWTDRVEVTHKGETIEDYLKGLEENGS